jgi:hypothetical protein
MTMAAPQGNDATLTAAAGQRRLQWQWWRQKQWDKNDGDDWRQRLQVAAVTMAGADNNQQEAAVGVAKTAVVAAAGAEGRRLWWQRRLKCAGSGGNGINNVGDR